MNIQLASDLHLEFLQQKFPRVRLITPVEGADVLVLAGDIATGTQAIDLFADWPVPVLYVAGNHEFYGHSFEQMRIDMRRQAQGTAVHFMDNDVLVIGGVRFLGATLWTDYQLRTDRPQREAMDVADRCLNDHHLIRSQQGRFTPDQALQEHDQSRAWLARQLANPFDGKTAVVTHHGPHRGSTHPRYEGDPLNAAFVSDLTDLVCQADLWLHGHVHDSFDYPVGQCRVVANPRGYARNRHAVRRATDLVFENPAFQEACLLVVDDGHE